MDAYEKLERLQYDLARLRTDARAEAPVAQALDEGVAPEDLLVAFDGFFYREYSEDLLYAEMKDDAARQAFLQLHLTRSGMADNLPEALFFAPSGQRIRNATDMAEEYRRNKKKLAEIRKFFQPFEHQFFWQGVELEREEAALLHGLEKDMLTDYFVQFWNLSPAIPKRFLTPLILLLPYAHQITGNLALTQTCLRLLLQEEVTITQDRNTHTEAQGLNLNLGEQSLGVSAVCGEGFEEDTPLLTFRIGPLKASKVNDYLEGGARFELLNTFVSFFLPLDADTVFEVEVPEEARHRSMGEAEAPVLGYSSFL